MTIEGRSNVCCVQFHPQHSHYVVFGSADHSINLYDTRNPKMPLFFFHGHRKAVSYIRFISSTEFVSASTDSTLKLWNFGRELNEIGSQTFLVTEPNPSWAAYHHQQQIQPINFISESKKFTGHINERNFVGLTPLSLPTTNSMSSPCREDFPWFACGSENNAIYIYDKNIGQPILQYHFAPVSAFVDRSMPMSGQFPWSLAIPSNRQDYANYLSSRIPSTFLQNIQMRLQSTAATQGNFTPRAQLRNILFNDDSASLAINPDFHSLASVAAFASMDPPTAGPHFISALTYRHTSNHLLAANSQGLLKILGFKSY